MKISVCVRIGGVGIATCFGLLKASAELEVSATVQIHSKAEFEAPLAHYGAWVQVGSYGRCWRPTGLAAEWRPYCSGQWVWTECGWYWASDEPWNWACYHYGAWVCDPALGWVWVPATDWAPAWVSWRMGGGFIGWAPLPPPGILFAHRPKPELFVFIGADRITEPVKVSAIALKNKTLFMQTSEVGGIKRETISLAGSPSQRVMFAHGPDVALVTKATGKPLRTVPIAEALGHSRDQASLKVVNPAPKSKTERDGSLAPFRSPPDRRDHDGAFSRDRLATPEEHSGPSHGPGGDHGDDTGHGKGKG